MAFDIIEVHPNAVQARQLAAIHAACFAATGRWSANDFTSDAAKSRIILTDLLIAEGVLVLQCVGDEAEVLTLGVVPAARGKGMAVALMERGLNIVRGRDVRNIFLEVAEDNLPAIDLYQRLGFKTTGRRKRYYRRETDDRVDALLMAKHTG
jgi:ribosomal-protein-alanine N-acetyltransferase